MAGDREPDQNALEVRLLHGVGVALPAIGLVLCWWVPVARRMTVMDIGDGHRERTIDTATLPGLLFSLPPDGHTTTLRVTAAACVVLGVVWAVALHQALTRMSRRLAQLAAATAIVLPFPVIFLVQVMIHGNRDLGRGAADFVEPTSGWLVVALLPGVLAWAAQLMLGVIESSTPPAPPDAPDPPHHWII